MTIMKSTIGNKSDFAIEYAFLDDTRETEIAMYIHGVNVLAYDKQGLELTTRWNLDDIANWLRGFLNNMQEDPYPVGASGKYAAEKDISAREFDSADEDEFDAYYDKLDEWNARHRWHPAAAGAIIADVYFQLVGEEVEISWNNQDLEDGVEFKCLIGGDSIENSTFFAVIDEFLINYANHWF